MYEDGFHQGEIKIDYEFFTFHDHLFISLEYLNDKQGYEGHLSGKQQRPREFFRGTRGG